MMAFGLTIVCLVVRTTTIISALAFSPRLAPPTHRAVCAKASSDDGAEALLAQAAALRREAEELMGERPVPAPEPRLLRVVLPISKPDWSVVDEEVEFQPFLNASEIVKVEVRVPCGLILEEQADAGVAVVEVGAGSNAEQAGVRVGDRLRATSAVRLQMEMPTWQLVAGGIGRPKSFRFIFGCDLVGPPPRSFDDVLAAVASNRDDPDQRPALLVLERLMIE